MPLVNTYVNKAFVGSGHGDAPKYAGEGVVSCDPLVSLAGKSR